MIWCYMIWCAHITCWWWVYLCACVEVNKEVNDSVPLGYVYMYICLRYIQGYVNNLMQWGQWKVQYVYSTTVWVCTSVQVHAVWSVISDEIVSHLMMMLFSAKRAEMLQWLGLTSSVWEWFIYREDLAVIRVQMISAKSTGFGIWQVHRFSNILLIRVAGWGKERRS